MAGGRRRRAAASGRRRLRAPRKAGSDTRAAGPVPDDGSAADGGRMRSVPLVTAGFLGAAVVVASAVAASGLGDGPPRAGAPRAAAAAAPAPGTPTRFGVLARQHPNRCPLQPAALMAYPPGQRLRGSCFSALAPAP